MDGFGQWTEMFIFKFLEASLSLLCRQLWAGKQLVLLQYSKWNIRTGGLDKGMVVEVMGRAPMTK